MRRIFNACLCALLFMGGALVQGQGVAHAAEEQQSITLVSGGSGAPGSNDPLVTASLDGETFQPAVITSPHALYSTLPGTQWVTVDGGAFTTVRYRLPFTLPAGAVGPSLVADVHADNYAQVMLNGTSLGTQSSDGGVANFQDPAEQFSTDDAAHFVTGENYLDVLVTDQAPPNGLDVSAVVRYTPEGGTTPTPPTVSIADAEVDEGDDGAPVAALTVTIDPPSAVSTSVTVATTNGTAGRRDYVSRDPYVVNFDANQATATVSIPIVPDTALEPDETFSVVLSAPTGDLVLGDATGEVTIRDDDPLTLSIGDASGPEGGNVDLPITFSSPALESGSVLASTSNGSAEAPRDFAPALGRMIAWEAGATKTKVRVAAANDDLFEGAETFSVSLTDPEGAVIEDGSATGTIVDGDDAPPPPPRITISNATATEGDPGAAGILAFGLSIDVAQQAPVSVTVETRAGTANGSDYVQGTQTVSIATAARSATLSIPLRADLLPEGQEKMTARVVSASYAGGAAPIDRSDGIGTINDDDPRAPRITISNATATEGDPDPGTAGVLAFGVSIDNPQKAPVSVTVETRAGTANGSDYVQGTQTVSIPPGARSTTLSIPLRADLLPEGQEKMTAYIVSARVIGVSGPGVDSPMIVRYAGEGTINDDDPYPPRVTISNATATEGDPGTPGTLGFGISIDRTQKAPVSVSVETRAGTANGSDYVNGTQTVTIAPGARSASLSIPLRADLVNEPQEKMTAHIISARLVGVDPRQASVGINRYDGEGTINDDDPFPPVWTVSNASVLEGDPGAANVLPFIIDIDRAQKEAVGITYQATAGSAQAGDFQAVTGFASIPAGSRRVTVQVSVVGDIAVEGDETVKLTISSPRLGRVNRSQGIGTIKDDDAFPIVSIFDGQGAEGTEFDGTAPFVVRLDHASADAVEVDFATVLNGKVAGAASGSDLTMISGTITFAPGETERIINVTLHADSLVEVDEHFSVQLTGVRGAKFGDKTATGLIGNDDGGGPETAT